MTGEWGRETDVLILCGGFGTRMRPAIGVRQKVAVDVGGRPVLVWQLDRLAAAGACHVVLAAGFGADEVGRIAEGHSEGLEIDLSIEPRPLGTGGAIKFARRLGRSGRWLILNGDCLSEVDFAKFVEYHRSKESAVTLTVTRRDDAHEYGTVAFEADGRITAFREKEAALTTGFVSLGVYCFNDEAFDWMPSREAFSIEKDFFPEVLRHPVFAYREERPFVDVGTPERLKVADDLMRKDRST